MRDFGKGVDYLRFFAQNGAVKDEISEIESNIPLEALVSTDRNMYELTNAAIHRAKQISMTGSETLEKTGGRSVSLAIREIVTGEVQYSIKKD